MRLSISCKNQLQDPEYSDQIKTTALLSFLEYRSTKGLKDVELGTNVIIKKFTRYYQSIKMKNVLALQETPPK
ncbi:hypothetical protein F8M41_001189 [Gigaspora margarita]|uniref:Uncharacterized protein n=1 Tax=Gigaspora margarita TaxID=4874 RepID=A0A8H3XER3_GIGMA|nr:hypothetical protein F8M41_001189 [Gigaspora margarita]